MSDLRLARIVSAAAHPFVLVPVAVSLATGNLRWTAILTLITLLPMTAVIVWNVRRGVWSDFDVSRRDQRSGLYWVAIPLLILTTVFIDAPPALTRGMLAVAVVLVIGLAGNRFLKTSLHMMFAAYCAVILVRAYPWSPALTFPLVATLAWSRWRLGRHTPVEIAAGVVLGLAAGLYAIA